MDNTIEIDAGEPVAECPNCGVVTDVEYRFPHPSRCRSCDAECTDTRIAPETIEVAADRGER